jgi:hypothetical protein
MLAAAHIPHKSIQRLFSLSREEQFAGKVG